MKVIEAFFIVIILICFCILTWISVFIWHNLYTAVLFTAAVFVLLWILKTEQNNDYEKK